MKTKFNFKSLICTTIEQSERLLALGIRKETADMTIHIKNDDGWYVTAEPFYEWEDDMNTIPSLEETEPILPAWSLHRLWELLSKIKKYEGEDELMYPRISIEEDDVILVNPKSIWVRRSFCSPKGVYENIINCFELLIREGYFDKDYLV